MIRQLDIFDLPQQTPVIEFDGAVYDPDLDQKRLIGQIKEIYELMKDGKFRTLGEIENLTGHPQASISAQLRNLKKVRFGNHGLEKRRRGEAKFGLWEYRLIVNELS